MDLDDSQKFILYTLGTGILLVMLACIIQFCLIPGAECRIPFFTPPDEKSYIYEKPPDLVINENADYQTILHTDLGDIMIDLYEHSTPVTVNNFVFLAEEGYYDGVQFHMVKEDVVIQTGDRNSLDDDPSNDGLGGPGYTFADEVNWDSLDIPEIQREELRELGFSNNPSLTSFPPRKYAVLMANAREGNTNGSQFFIVTMPATDSRLLALRGKHTVFGEVIEGFDVVDKINSVDVEDTENPGFPYPKDHIEIEFVDIIEIVNGEVNINGDKSGRTSRNNNLNL